MTAGAAPLPPFPPTPDAVTRVRTRSQALDAARGAAILAVVAIHVSGHFLHRVQSGSALWLGLAAPNRLFQCAVPAFILISAFLNSANLLRGYSLRRYAWSRGSKVLWPYLLWTAIGVAVSAATTGPPLSSLTPAAIQRILIWGKGYYHLYFMVIVLQLFILLPFLLPLLRKRLSLPPLLVGAAAAQLLILVGNRQWFHWQFVGSLVLWYLLPVGLGIWLAGRGDQVPEALQRVLAPTAVVCLAAAVPFLWLELTDLRGGAVNTVLYQAVEWTYTAAAALLLLAILYRLPPGRGLVALAGLGQLSLQIYLVHPFVILFMDLQGGLHLRPVLAVPLYWLVAVAASYGIGQLLRLLRLSPILFGS